MTAPASIDLIPDVISTAEGTYTENSVQIPGSPYIYKLGAGLPIPYPTGMQVIPPTGVPNAVQISGGGHGSWTQVASAPAAGQFTVDTTISPTGGQIGFSSADAFSVTGLTISITYLANTYVNKAWAEAFVTALRDLRDWRGAASGLAGLNSNSRLTDVPETGVRQVQAQSLFGTATGIAASATLGPFGNGFTMTTTGGKILAELGLGLVHTGTDTGQSIQFYLAWTGAASGNALCGTINGFVVPQNGRTQLYLPVVVPGLAAGSYTFQFAYSSGTIAGWTTGDGFNPSWGKITEFV